MADYNALLKKWNLQVSENSGFHVPFKLGYEIHAPLALYATIGVNSKGGAFYKRIPCPSRTYEAPWLERFTNADVKENAQTVGAEASFDALQGTFKRYNLDTQLSVAKVVAGIERETVPYDYVGFYAQEAARILAIKSEDRFIQNVISNGAKGDGTREGHEFDADMVVRDTNGDVDFYKTIVRAVKVCTEQGWADSDMIIYVSPAVAELLMTKGILLGNNYSSATTDIMLHKNMVGVVAGIPVIRVPRLSVWESHATTPINMLVCNVRNIFLLEYMRTPLQLTPVTEKHLDPTDRYLKALSWIEWALKVENAAFFLNAVAQE